MLGAQTTWTSNIVCAIHDFPNTASVIYLIPMQHEYSQAPPQCTQPKASSWAERTVTGINCGSLEEKLHQLYCYLILAMPDVVCLQQVWTIMPEGWLNGLPYQQAASQPF